jgi:hypothetical protein
MLYAVLFSLLGEWWQGTWKEENCVAERKKEKLRNE